MRARPDVAVVGAGITGLSIAFHLADAKAVRVAVYDRERIGAGASWIAPGGVRQQWSTYVNCVLARDSLAFYRELVARLEPPNDPGWRACGYLFLAHEQETFDRLGHDVALQGSLGIASRLVAASEAAELVPGLRPERTLGGAWCGDDGYFDRPRQVVEAFAVAAVRSGVTVERGEVAALEPTRSGWRLRFADRTTRETDVVVVAAAAGTTALLEPLGVELPVEVEERFLFYGDAVEERLLDPLVVASDRRFAAKQLADGRLLASDLSASGDPAEGERRWRANVRRTLAELLPRLESQELRTLLRGEYDVTPDRQAIVGAVPGVDGLFVAAGFSGHGFMIAPEIGRGVSALVRGEDPGEALAALALDRFGRAGLHVEARVI